MGNREYGLAAAKPNGSDRQKKNKSDDATMRPQSMALSYENENEKKRDNDIRRK